MSDDSEKRMLRRAVRVLAVPWLMAAAVLLSYLLGVYLDGKLGLSVPVATIGLVAFAIVGGAYQSYRVIMKAIRD